MCADNEMRLFQGQEKVRELCVKLRKFVILTFWSLESYGVFLLSYHKVCQRVSLLTIVTSS